MDREVRSLLPSELPPFGSCMDREALIARLRTGRPTQLTLEAANALASDAKFLEELKALCDKHSFTDPINHHTFTTPIEVHEIRAIFGWNAPTKDLHTQTTKGDT